MSPKTPLSPQKASAALVFVLSLAVAPFAAAQETEIRYRDGRFLETVGAVTLQRADEAGSEEATLNMPFLPGDRVWTDQSGRAEIVFADGEILWIAPRSKVDSLGRGGPDQDERLGLRVFAGSFAARVRPGGPGFEFRAPGGSITTTGAAAFRVDVSAGETIVSVSEGEILANLGTERMTVRAGDRVRYADGRVDGPYAIRRGDTDEFDRWCELRSAELNRLARTRDHERLPDELDAYGEELDENGAWVYDEPQGYVYVPRVGRDWAPYTYGRWVYTLYGWTWVADEPWGFVTSHYGRWGYSSRVGWHWLPKAGFSGAWVSWASPVGQWNHTIGWCALGFDNRPVRSFAYGSGGRGVARDRAGSAASGWSFANRADMGRASIHRLRANVPPEEAERAAVWNEDVTPDRNLRESRRAARRPSGLGQAAEAVGGAIGRGEGRTGSGADTAPRINIRPSPGDSTPELRSDPTTTIPTPESRRRRGFGQDGFKEEQDNRGRRNRLDETSPSGTDADTGRSRQGNGGAATPEAGRGGGNAATKETGSDQPARDPLLDRFFRSITRPDSTGRDSGSSRSDDSATRRRESPPREDNSAHETSGRERSTPPATATPERRAPERERERERSSPPPRTYDQGRERERSRPSGGERPEPRAEPRAEPAPKGGSSDNQAARRRPRPEGR